MKKIILLLSFAWVWLSCSAQNNTIDYNFGFEAENSHKGLPDGWFDWGNNTTKTETFLSQTGIMTT